MTTPEVHPPLLPTSRMEALEWATEYCAKNKIFEPPSSSDRYAKFEPPSSAQRILILRDIANWLLEESEYKSGLD